MKIRPMKIDGIFCTKEIILYQYDFFHRSVLKFRLLFTRLLSQYTLFPIPFRLYKT